MSLSIRIMILGSWCTQNWVPYWAYPKLGRGKVTVDLRCCTQFRNQSMSEYQIWKNFQIQKWEPNSKLGVGPYLTTVVSLTLRGVEYIRGWLTHLDKTRDLITREDFKTRQGWLDLSELTQTCSNPSSNFITSPGGLSNCVNTHLRCLTTPST